MVDYSYVQAALLLQMVLWLKLYHMEVEMGALTQVLFYLGCMVSGALVWIYQPLLLRLTELTMSI